MKSIVSIPILSLVSFTFLAACTKNSNPNPPPPDTVTLVKTDTLIIPPAPDPTVNLTKGLLLYLPFNGSIADNSGNNNPTYAVGNVLGYDAHGFANSAFNGDGAGTKVVVLNNGSIQFDTAYSYSYDFMVNMAPAGKRQAFLTMVDTATGNGPSFVSGASQPGIGNICDYASDVSANCDEGGPAESVNTGVETDTTSFVPLLNTWYNVVTTYNKGALTIYINGQQVGFKQRSGTAALLCPNAAIVVGGWWNGDPVPLSGKMDEVRLYNRVLTPHEIVALTQHYQVASENFSPRVVRGR